MDEYIKREDAITALLDVIWDDEETLREILDSVPTSDVVPIVRCQNCRYWERNEPEVLRHGGFCYKHREFSDENGYCLEGECSNGVH